MRKEIALKPTCLFEIRRCAPKATCQISGCRLLFATHVPLTLYDRLIFLSSRSHALDKCERSSKPEVLSTSAPKQFTAQFRLKETVHSQQPVIPHVDTVKNHIIYLNMKLL